MKRRIFVAINLPEHIKKRIVNWQEEWASLPIRWTKRQSLHITLVFIGYAGDEEMLEVCQKTKEIGKRHRPFEVELKRIYWGPPARNASRSDAGGPGRSPRMIWLEGEKNIGLAKLKDDLESQLFNSSQSGYNNKEVRAFRPHITLARIRQREWQLMPLKPNIEKEVSLSFLVESIEVMESRLLRDGAEYIILESVILDR